MGKGGSRAHSFPCSVLHNAGTEHRGRKVHAPSSFQAFSNCATKRIESRLTASPRHRAVDNRVLGCKCSTTHWSHRAYSSSQRNDEGLGNRNSCGRRWRPQELRAYMTEQANNALERT